MRMEQAKKTAAYRVVADSGGNRVFRFYCDISDKLRCRHRDKAAAAGVPGLSRLREGASGKAGRAG